MNYIIIFLESFAFQGLKRRTTNENNLARKEISILWEKFHSQEFSKKIQYPKGKEIYAIYTEYEKDNTVAYTYYLGHKVKKMGGKIKDLYHLMIPAGKYALVEVTGKFPEALITTWKEIWSSYIPRAYTFDLEVYNQDFFTESTKKMKIYLSLNI